MQGLLEGKPYDVNFRIQTADTGEIRDIHSIAVFDKEKRTVSGVIQDITEQARILRALKQEELWRRTLLEQTPDGIAVITSYSIHYTKLYETGIGMDYPFSREKLSLV